MKKKLLKKFLSNIYYRGLNDGMDITLGSRDRFFGNSEQRRQYELENLEKDYQVIKKLV
jgi:hypothetical protein